LCFGEATKFSQFLLDADKGYRTCIRLGATTDTCDADGEIIEQKSAAGVTRAQVEAALKPLLGDILQVPPMYSALKLNGQPLYKMARQGVEVERAPRPVTIHSIDILAFRAGEDAEVELDIRCTKGTYIRSIAVDLGIALGCGGHVKTLHRSHAGLFDETQCVTLEELQTRFDDEQAKAGDEAGFSALDSYLLSTDAPVASLPAVDLPANSAHYFRLGNPVMVSKVYRFGEQGAIVRVFCAETDQSPRAFLGLGSINGEGGVAPKRILANRSANER
jgi:tRNA pseudouridine55 synthase